MIMEKKEMGIYREWICGKCGMLRTNHAMHKHGVPLSKDVLKAIKERKTENKEKVQPHVGVHREED